MSVRDKNRRSPKIAIVGPCAAGKSTLRQALHKIGYRDVHNPAQEHSYVPDMWQKLTRPDILIYLDVDYPTMRRRRPHQDGGPQWLATQNERLKHARRHTDLYVDTRALTPDQVCERVVIFLSRLPAE